MRKLEKPTDLPTEVFLECISNYRDKDLKTRLSSYTDEIKKVAETYEKKVQNASLHTLATQDKEDGVVKKSDMIDVYKNKFSKKGQPGRTYYDKLMAIPKSKKCPLCGQRVVSSLDHHLPKTKYPVLSVTPVNLVPACSDCNKIKEASKPESAEEETLHPYFDNVEDEIWLKAELIHDNPIGFKFFVTDPQNWDELKIKRVKHHFKLFELGPLYSLYAGEELTMLHSLLVNIFDKIGAQGLKSQLLDFKNSSEKVYLNSWQTAMYRALANSEWFCNEGIHQNFIYG